VILKEKTFTNPSDPRLLAGEEAEKQLAHYLKRAFKKRDDCFVINDLRVTYDGEVAQIDHLIVSPYGLVIIESKSCHSTIIVDEFNRWARTFNDKAEGMKSPVLQAIEQGKVVRELLRANVENLLGKMLLGSLQKGFAYCPFLVYVSVSDSGIIAQQIDVPELYKADEVSKAITEKLDELKKKSDLLSPKFWLSSSDGWRMTLEEANSVANFLLSQHMPRKLSSDAVLSEAKEVTVMQPAEQTFVPRVGARCPVCGKHKLIRKSINRNDGTETDFLACQGYPNTCKALFPLVAVIRQATPDVNQKPSAVEGVACPKCGIGKKVRRKGRAGKPDFIGCSNYGKTKCGYQESIP